VKDTLSDVPSKLHSVSTPEWAWSAANEFVTHGPFSCREFALADAQEYADDEDWEREEIILGHAVLPDPAAYVLADVDHILEQMENAAMADERYALEGKTTVFECVALETAKSEFALLLQAWAAKWVEATAFTFEEVERIELTGTLGRGVE